MKKFLLTSILFVFIIVLSLGISAFDINEEFDYETFECEEATLPYRIYVPSDYDAESKYPLVVFLHGAGERGNDNEIQLKNAVQTLFDRDDGLMMNSIVIAPQCPVDNQWVDTPWADGNYSTDEIPESNELKAVMLLIDAIEEKYSIDKARIYAMGVSMGGFGTWDLIIRHNDVFAGAAPMCGGGDPSKAAMLLNTPIYTFHGTSDNSVPFEGTEEMVTSIEDEGGRLINFIVYNGEGHGIWEKASAEADWLGWLFEQKLTDRYPELTEDTEAEPVVSDTENVTEGNDTEGEVSESGNLTDNEIDSAENSTDESDKKFSVSGIIIVAVIVPVILIAGAAILIIKSKKK